MTLLKVNQSNPNGWMNDFLNDLPSVFGKTFTENSLTPQVNILEKNDAYLLELSAPGRTKEDFKINIDKNLLTISYEKKDEQKNENEKYIRKEFNVPSFKRSFTLDDKIDADNIKAKYENGLLIFDLPKKAEVKATAKEIVVE